MEQAHTASDAHNQPCHGTREGRHDKLQEDDPTKQPQTGGIQVLHAACAQETAGY